MSKTRISKETIQSYMDRYNDGESLLEIASTATLGKTRIRQLLIEYGVTLRPAKPKDYNKLRKKPKYVGQIMSSKNNGDFKVLEYVGNTIYKIRFINTGTTKEVDNSNLIKGNVYDEYKRNYWEFGYLGEMYGKANSHPMMPTWEKMIERCATNKYNYSLDLICNEWANFTTFAHDVEQLPFYDRRVKEGGKKWNLDKDVLGFKKYSKDTCLWIPQQMNVQVAGVYDMINMGFKIEYPSREHIIKYIEANY